MSVQPDLLDLLKRIKSDYLDSRHIGIRRFAEMSAIRRTRLNRLFGGSEIPTPDELSRINDAIQQIEETYQKTQTRKKETAPVALPTIHGLELPTYVQPQVGGIDVV